MKNFLKKKREIVAIFLYVAMLFGLFYFLILPLIDRIEKKSNQIQEGVLSKENVQKRLGELPRIKQLYESLGSKNGNLDVLLDKNSAVFLIEKLEKLAQDTGNEISISAQEKIEQPKTVSKGKQAVDESLIGKLPSANYLQIKIILNGEYASIRNFIKLLENMEYYGDIVAIKISQEALDEKSKTQPTTFSASNPFAGSVASQSITEDGVRNESEEADKLKASIDTVFYIK